MATPTPTTAQVNIADLEKLKRELVAARTLITHAQATFTPLMAVFGGALGEDGAINLMAIMPHITALQKDKTLALNFAVMGKLFDEYQKHI